jgi:hypothetical protein
LHCRVLFECQVEGQGFCVSDLEASPGSTFTSNEASGIRHAFAAFFRPAQRWRG